MDAEDEQDRGESSGATPGPPAGDGSAGAPDALNDLGLSDVGWDVSEPSAPRSKAQIAFLVAAMVLIPLGLIVLFLAFRGGERPNNTSTAPQTVVPGAFAPNPGGLAGRWNIYPPDSWVGYAIGENLFKLPAPHTAEGKTPAVDGGIVITSDGRVVATAFNADMTQLTSDEPDRDEAMAVSGLETATYPTASFVATEPIVLTAVPAPGQHLEVKAKGDLTLHGVTKPVELTMQAAYVPGTTPMIEITGSAPITLADFGITPPSVGGVVEVQDHGELRFHLRLARLPDEIATNTVPKPTGSSPGTTPGSTAGSTAGSTPGTTRGSTPGSTPGSTRR